MTTMGFIGSGNIGSTAAGLAVAAGYDVVLSNSRGPQTLQDLVSELGPRARAATAAETAAAGDVVSAPPIAGDDAAAKQAVSELFDSLGFDTVDAGPLAEN